jgi:hypothetical protein
VAEVGERSRLEERTVWSEVGRVVIGFEGEGGIALEAEDAFTALAGVADEDEEEDELLSSSSGFERSCHSTR